jgi:hypothetical protein
VWVWAAFAALSLIIGAAPDATAQDDLPKIEGDFPLVKGDIPQEGGEVTRFIEGTNAMAFGSGEDSPAFEVGGDPDEVRIQYPSEPVEKPKTSQDIIYTRILSSVFGGSTIPLKGHIGEDRFLPDYFPSYRRGWEPAVGGGVQIGFDAGIVGFFVEASYQIFESAGQTFTGTGGWYRYSDIKIMTFTPGFKLQFQNWLKYLYAGTTQWEVSWFDYMLHSFPYFKFGVGPIVTETMEVTSDSSTSSVKYWRMGMSYTFFFFVGLEWRPYGKYVSGFFEVGIQSFIFTTATAYAQSPDWLTAVPVRLGIAVNF